MSGMQVIEGICGEYITKFCERLVVAANTSGAAVTGRFNEVDLVAEPGGDAGALAQRYTDESRRRYEEYLASDLYRQRMEEARLAEERRRATHAAAIADAEARNVFWPTWRDVAAYESWKAKNVDGYSRGCFTYAETWARLMEARILAGQTVAECAGPTSRIADVDGITGAMHGFAVGILKECWIHGDDLLAWHRAGGQ
jgi:hypothetical protein